MAGSEGTIFCAPGHRPHSFPFQELLPAVPQPKVLRGWGGGQGTAQRAFPLPGSMVSWKKLLTDFSSCFLLLGNPF